MSEATGAGQRADTDGLSIYPAGMDRAWPPQQYPAPLPPAARRRWPVFVGGVAIGAAIAAAITAALMASTRDTATRTPVTITAAPTPPAPTTPAPLPAAEANRHTCDAYSAAGKQLRMATESLQVIPPDITIVAPEVRANPDWSAAVQRAADLYGQAAMTLATGLAPGSTPALDQTANAFSDALRAMATAYRTYDDAVGDIYAVGKASDGAMSVLCKRLAPR